MECAASDSLCVYLQITQAGELRRAGPDFLLSGGSSYPEELYTYGGLAVQGGQGQFQVGVATAVAPADCSTISEGAAAETFTS